jgi:dephospho-CoA kinase
VHVFGLTGGIASGKSAVAARLRARGVPVIDADLLARDAVAPGSEGLAEVVAAFGPDFLLPDGSLDRKKLGREVFARGDEDKRRRLNAIVHPRVSALTFQAAAKLRDAGEPLACYEAPLIVENGLADAFRPLVVVSAPEDVQVARAAARDGSTVEEARERVRAQLPLAEKVAAADLVIDNTGSREELQRRTDEVLAALCQRLGVELGRYPTS